MRVLHRSVGIITALFLAVLAITGIVLQLQEMGRKGGRPGGGAFVSSDGPAAPLPVAEAGQWMSITLQAAQKAVPNAPVTSLQLRMFGGQPQSLVTVASPEPRQLIFNARTGEVMSSSASPASGVGAGDHPISQRGPSGGKGQPQQKSNLHRLVMGLHKGSLFGAVGEWVGLICGISLFLLCSSGVVIYYKLWRLRVRSGRKSLLWA